LIVSMALIPVLACLRLMQAQRQRADNGTFMGLVCGHFSRFERRPLSVVE
jgi:hypothetical protein